jgi:hypothetical protein
MRRIGYAAAAGSLAIGALLAGSAAGQAAVTPPRGTVAGRTQVEGGPVRPGRPQPGPRPLRGTVGFQAAAGAHRQVSVATGKAGTFSIRLAPGIYHVTVRSPQIREQGPGGRLIEPPCAAPRTVKVVAGRTARVTLTCIVP